MSYFRAKWNCYTGVYLNQKQEFRAKFRTRVRLIRLRDAKLRDSLPVSSRAASRRLGLIAFAVACIVSLFVFKIENYDLWWHMKTGAEILRTGEVPSVDPYSFTAGGRFWVNPSWLADIALWDIQRLFGVEPLVLFKAMMGVVAFALVVVRTRKLGVAEEWALVGALGGAYVCQDLCIVRPLMASWPLAALFALMLDEQMRGRGRGLWVLPALMCLWANLHAGYVAGLLLVAAYAVGAWFGPSCNRRRRTLVALGALMALGALVNPFGLHVYLYPFRLMGSTVFMKNIREWMRPAWNSAFVPYWTYLFVAGLVMIGSWRRLRAWERLVLMGFGLLSVTGRRHISMFVILTVPIVMKGLLPALARAEKIVGISRLRTAALLLACCASVLAVVFDDAHQQGVGVRKYFLPEKGVDFLERENVSETN